MYGSTIAGVIGGMAFYIATGGENYALGLALSVFGALAGLWLAIKFERGQ